MGPLPILSVIQPVNIGTMLYNKSLVLKKNMSADDLF